jgi:hypothetical protein
MNVPAAVSALVGALMFSWIAGVSILDPREIGWVFHGDWQWHFFGWHFFRHEPWHLPPGLLTTYLEPIGTSVGYTDSIPLVALVLKPFAPLLPNPFQYLGLWLVLCFALQGFFGSLLVRVWTENALVRTVGGSLFVLVPTLLARLAHPALCAHWLLLWALWLALRGPALSGAAGLRHHIALSLVSGLVHPYLAVMVIAILLALWAKRTIAGGWIAAAEGGMHFIAAGGAVLVGWWTSGLLTLASADDLSTIGLGQFSSNLLGVVNPGPRSQFLPALPWFSAEQEWEGFHYLGAGMLMVCGVAAIRAVSVARRVELASLPLAIVLLGLTAFSLSPRVTLGDRVVLDLLPYVGDTSVFRATARFFWPMMYALVAAGIGSLAAVLTRRAAAALLLGALVLQVADLGNWFLSLHRGFHDPAFLHAKAPRPSAAWADVLPHFQHMRLYLPNFCDGPAPLALVDAAYLAGRHALALNDGVAARTPAGKLAVECERLRQELAEGTVDSRTVYVVAPALVPEFQTHERGATCRSIDSVAVCVATASANRLPVAW